MNTESLYNIVDAASAADSRQHQYDNQPAYRKAWIEHRESLSVEQLLKLRKAIGF